MSNEEFIEKVKELIGEYDDDCCEADDLVEAIKILLRKTKDRKSEENDYEGIR